MRFNGWKLVWLVLSVAWVSFVVLIWIVSANALNHPFPVVIIGIVFLGLLPPALLYAIGLSVVLIIRRFRRSNSNNYLETSAKSTNSLAYKDGVTGVRKIYWRSKLAIAAGISTILVIGIFAGLNKSFILLAVFFIGMISARLMANMVSLRQAVRWGIPPRAAFFFRSPYVIVREIIIVLSSPGLPLLFWNGLQEIGLVSCIVGAVGFQLCLILMHRAYRRSRVLILRHFGADSHDLLAQRVGPVVRHIGLPVSLTEKDVQPQKLFGIDSSGIEFRKIQDPNWQPTVLSEMREAIAIVFDVGVVTPAIEWELAIIAESFVDKVICVAPSENQAPILLPNVPILSSSSDTFQAQLGEKLASIVTPT